MIRQAHTGDVSDEAAIHGIRWEAATLPDAVSSFVRQRLDAILLAMLVVTRQSEFGPCQSEPREPEYLIVKAS